ncbi:MAG TPA: MbtH family NRPS accessory protein [Candidatus Sulfomarinibacteraceae bacterium]|nr:MbtH family NRPS accessory protein [Candidatus Sulfomarinibacteraceae bacterium]
MDTPDYKVIVSTQAQYAVWPAEVEPPLGWSEGEARGSLVACLDYIGDVWKDREVDAESEQFVVIANEDDILSISLDNEETPSGWREVTGPGSLAASLARIRDAWRESGPLPVQLRTEGSDDE